MDRDLVAFGDNQAADFDEAADHGLTDQTTRRAWQTLLSSALPPPPARIADLGCGTGTLSVLLAQMGYDVDGVDFSPAIIDRATAKSAGTPGLSFHIGDAAAPPLHAASYDAIICRHVLWALAEPTEALKRWAALMDRTGRLILVEGHWHTGAGLTAAQALGFLSDAGAKQPT